MTEKSGTIITEAWGDDSNPSPVHLVGDCAMGPDQVLNILPGCEIIADGDFLFEATDGQIVAGGEPSAPIHVHAASPGRGNWKGFKTQGAMTLNFLEVVLEDAEDAVSFVSGSGAFRKCRIMDCEDGFSIAGGVNTDLIAAEDCRFEANGRGLYFASDVAFYAGSLIKAARIVKNDVGIEMANGKGQVHDVGHRLWGNTIGVSLTGTYVGIDLMEIWWGSDSGPYQEIDNPTGTGDPAIYTATKAYISPWTQLKRYVPVVDDVRLAATRLLDNPPIVENITDDELEAIVEQMERRYDTWYSKVPRTKKLFAYDTETSEKHDLGRGERFVQTMYWPINVISAVEQRMSDGSYQALPLNELSGYYASADMMRKGRLAVTQTLSYDYDAVAMTYTHGYYDAPESIRDTILKLCAVEIYRRYLRIGGEETASPRIQSLLEDLKIAQDAAQEIAQQNKVRWKVI